MDQRFEIGRGPRRESSVQMSRSALHAPPPKDGEVLRTALPDDFDGIRFEIGRMISYIEAAVNDPVVMNHVSEICNIAAQPLRMNGAEMSGAEERDMALGAIDKWSREHFVYVNDPPNVEVLQTPRRMIKASRVPPAVIQSIIAPFYEAMVAVAPVDSVKAYEPPGICSGDCDEAGCLFNSQCAVAPSLEPIRPLRLRFGGHDGTLHHVWSRVGCGDRMVDCDLTEPNFALGDFSKFEHYEEVEIAL